MAEVEHPEVEPLPPTPITPEAAALLQNWGISEESLRRLQELTSSFRYDLTDKKVERLARESGYVGADSENNPLMILPYFFDIKARFDGQCGDIAAQWIQYMHASGLLTDMTEELADASRVVACFAHGLADTHFIVEGMSHTWNCLARVDAKGEVIDFIVVDAAMQKIFADDRYLFKDVVVDVTSFSNRTSHASLLIGSLAANDFGNWNLTQGEVLTIGMSQDRKFAYSVSFLACDATDSYVMCLTRTDDYGEHDMFMFDPLSKWLIRSDPQKVLQPEEENEIRRILTEAEAFTYSDANVMPPGSMEPYSVRFK